MRIGRLKKRVMFQRKAETLDAYGENVGGWSDLVTVSAAVEPIAGREFFAAMQVQNDVTTMIICRYSSAVSGVSTKDRIVFGTNTYDINSIINVRSENREIQFMCVQHSR